MSSISHCSESCPRCGSAAETQNAAIMDGLVFEVSGNSPQATLAFGIFQKQTLDRLLRVEVNRQQARRLERAIKGKGEDAVRRVAKEISPEIDTAVEQALKTDKPKEALRWVSRLVVFSAAAGTALFTVISGLNEGIDLIEKLSGDKPIHEILEELKQQQPDENRKGKSDGKASDTEQKKSYDKPNRVIDI